MKKVKWFKLKEGESATIEFLTTRALKVDTITHDDEMAMNLPFFECLDKEGFCPICNSFGVYFRDGAGI